MQTINYHGWTVNLEGGIYRADKDGEVPIIRRYFSDILDAIYERTYDLKAN